MEEGAKCGVSAKHSAQGTYKSPNKKQKIENDSVDNDASAPRDDQSTLGFVF